MSIQQKFLTSDNTQNGIFYPITDTNAVYDKNGNNLTEILTNINNIQFTSNIPIQTGFLNGIPIWKMYYKEYFDTPWDGTEQTISFNLPIKDLNKAFITNVQLMASHSGSSECLIDDDATIFIGNHDINYPTFHSVGNTYLGIYGFIEFVTPNENISSLSTVSLYKSLQSKSNNFTEIASLEAANVSINTQLFYQKNGSINVDVYRDICILPNTRTFQNLPEKTNDNIFIRVIGSLSGDGSELYTTQYLLYSNGLSYKRTRTLSIQTGMQIQSYGSWEPCATDFNFWNHISS